MFRPLLVATVAALAFAGTQPHFEMPYGKLHLMGTSATHEFFRATFGGLIGCASRPLKIVGQTDITGAVLGNLSSFNSSFHTGCDPLPDAEDVKGAFLVTWRGGCPFVQKAWNAQSAGAAGLIVVNTEAGLMRMPMGNLTTGSQVRIPVVMVRNTTTPLFLTLLAGRRASNAAPGSALVDAFLVPSKVACHPEEVSNGAEVNALGDTEVRTIQVKTSPPDIESGHLKLIARPSSAFVPVNGPLEFAAADFGAPLFPGIRANLVAVPGNGTLACGFFADGAFPPGSFVVVTRGECTMIDKARFAQHAGAGGVLIVGLRPSDPPADVVELNPGLDLTNFYGANIGAVQAINDDKLPLVHIPVFMLSYQSAGWLLDFLATPGNSVTVEAVELATEAGLGSAWTELTAIRDAGASYWPEIPSQREALLLPLIRKHHPQFPSGSVERYKFLETLCTLHGLGKELRQLTSSSALLTSEPPKKEAAVETVKPTFRIPHSPVSSFLSRNLPTSFLDLDDSAFTDCHTSFRQFNIRIPEFNPEDPFPLERRIADMLRTQMCLERVTMHMASSLGRALKQYEFERPEEMQRRAFYKAVFGNARLTLEEANKIVASYVQWSEAFAEALDGDRMATMAETF